MIVSNRYIRKRKTKSEKRKEKEGKRDVQRSIREKVACYLNYCFQGKRGKSFK